MTAELVRYERHGAVAMLSLCNPPLNVITADVRVAFARTLQEIRDLDEVRALVLTGDGDRSFCAGADLKEEEGLSPATVRSFLDEDRLVYDAVSEFPVPVVAAINGHCMGGGFELALACDLRIAHADAKLCAVGVKMGLVVSTTRLTQLVGPAVSSDIILTARTFTGAEAEQLRIVTRAVPGDAKVEALAWAQTIADRAPMAVRRAKRAIGEAADLPYEEAFSRELDHFAALSATRDHKEAIAAFFDRRPPIFENR